MLAKAYPPINVKLEEGGRPGISEGFDKGCLVKLGLMIIPGAPRVRTFKLKLWSGLQLIIHLNLL